MLWNGSTGLDADTERLGDGYMSQAVLAGLLAGAAMVAGCQAGSSVPRVERQPVGPAVVARDSSGLGNHGLNQGALVQGVRGRFGTAYMFTEPGSWIEVPSTSELNPEGANFLVSVWVKMDFPPPKGQTRDLFRKGAHQTPGGDLKVEIVDDGTVKCTVIGDPKGYATMYGQRKIADGTWHRVGCALTSFQLTALTDDGWVTKRTRVDPISNSVPVAIGSKYGVEDSAGGLIDEISYYIARPARDGSGLLPLPEQLKHLHKPEHLVGLWHLDERGSVRSPAP